MRCVAMRKASSQKEIGKVGVAKRAKPVSMICLCFLSTLPFWGWEYACVSLWVMPWSFRKLHKGMR